MKSRVFLSLTLNLIKNMKIVFMGTPEFAVPSLDAIHNQSQFEVVGVVTTPDKPTGRGQSISESAVKKYAIDNNLPLLQPEKLRDPLFIKQLKEWNSDVFVVVAFRWLPQEVWTLPRIGTINLHGSLLPQYRGAAPINRVIMNGESETGVTTFLIDKEIDTGKILLSEKISIAEDENAGSLHDKMKIIGANLLIKTLNGFIENDITPLSQDAFIAENSHLKIAPKIYKEDCEIDWSKEAKIIYNQIRGLSPYPGAFTTLNNQNREQKHLKIYHSSILLQKKEFLNPGHILTENNRLFIACKDAFLEVLELQIEGKKRLKTTDFLRGIDIKNYYI